MIGRPLDPGLEDRFQCVANVVGKNWAEGGIHYAGEIRLIAFDGLLPLRSFETIGALIGSLDGLDAFVADMAHPQGQSVIAQKAIIGIEIDRIQRFVGGIMKSARKMRMISEHGDVFGATRSFNSISLGSRSMTHYQYLPMA